MKSIVGLIFTILAFLLSSCDENPIINDDKDDETKNDTIEEIIDGDIIGSAELNFHNPSSIAFVKVKGETAKKFTPIDDDIEYYYLYQIVNDSFQLVTDKDGHEVYFSGIADVIKINDNWQLISPMSEMHGENLTIYKDYNETILTQHAETILFNVSSGELYDINTQIHYGIHEDGDNDPIYYDSINEYVYFKRIYEQTFCRLDLNSLSLECFDLPYVMTQNDVWCIIDGMIFYTSTITERKFLGYKPNEGYITKTNIYDITLDTPIDTIDTPDDTINNSIAKSISRKVYENNSIASSISVCHLGAIQPYFVCNNYSDGQLKAEFLSLLIRNDSMIFKTLPRTYSGISWIGAYQIGEAFQPIYHRNNKWYLYCNCLWSYDDVKNIYSAIQIDPMPTKVISDGNKHYGLSGDIIYRYDLDALEMSELITINTGNLQIHDVYIGHKSNLYVEGLRLSDLKDVSIEYDGTTGEKINEWVSEEAPPQSFITYLSPI